MHCRRFLLPALSRRELLVRAAGGFGSVALAALFGEPARGADAIHGGIEPRSGSLSSRPAQFRPRARSVIFLYMDGGVSQVDSFDPKPRLEKEHGQKFRAKIEPTQFDSIGSTLASPWKFQAGGQSGLPVSDLFPFLREKADRLCVVRSVVSNFSEHQQANYFLHTGHGQQGRPSMGAWFAYGLGTENQDLPGFVVINGGLIPSGGLDNFGNSFLPATYQGTIFRPTGTPIANVEPIETRRAAQRRKLDLLGALDREALARFGKVDAIESAIANYEMAFRMQSAVPELSDLASESEGTRRLYGLESSHEPTRIFGAECLLARRMVERGVRFVELTCPNTGNDRWDAHGNLRHNHGENARAVDQPIAGLITDLEQRGLLDETLIVWSGEFGRTPFAQGSDGRDHNPLGFSVWLAGGGVRGGTAYGSTDDYGYRAVENRVEVHDLHATMLHLLGVDHKRVTFRWSGRDMRLTDVFGEVIEPIIA
jgi:hypothetical protein